MTNEITNDVPILENNKYKVKADNFSVFYGDFEAVKNISFKCATNKVTAIIGPSGCGKSTLLRAINQMNSLVSSCYTKGKLFLDDVDIYGPKIDITELRKKVGMVFQKPNPFPKTIFDNIAFGLKIHGIRNRRTLFEIVKKSLKDAALWEETKDRLNKPALALSGGQQQRLCIARAIAINPQILLMDEPTSALDPQATSSIESLINKLRGTYTVIIVTHNMQQAARVSDYTAFLYEGNLIEFGTTKRIFTNPIQKKTEEYITGRFG